MRMYSPSPSDAFCLKGLFKICFLHKAHLETCYYLLCLLATSKEPMGMAFFSLMCAFSQGEKKKATKTLQLLNQFPK